MRRRMMVAVVAVSCAVTLTVSGSAFARAGGRTLAETYPVAVGLCHEAVGGTLPPKLAAHRGDVIAACDTLANTFGPLVSAVDAAESQYLMTVAEQRSLVAAACTRPVKDHAACAAARETRRSTDVAALVARQNAVRLFHTEVENARRTFWAAIQALRH